MPFLLVLQESVYLNKFGLMPRRLVKMGTCATGRILLVLPAL